MSTTHGSGPATPGPEFQKTIADLESLRVASHPLRQQILAALNGEPRAVREVAAELGVDPHKLYYHVHLLERHELVRVVEERVVSGIVEKRYQVTAYDFVVDSALVSPGSPQGGPALEEVLRHTIRRTEGLVRDMAARGVIDLRQRAPHPRALLTRANYARLTPARAGELSERILDLIHDFCRDHAAQGDEEHGYWLAVQFHPCTLDDTSEPVEGSPHR